MPFTRINDIDVRYEVYGSGPPLVMCAPGGFNSTIEMWGRWWARVKPIETFSQRYTCIAYDRREAGQSGGRVERLSWSLYGQEVKGLMDHLGIERAFVIGGCMGCPVALAFAVDNPDRTAGLIIHFPVGGAKWRMNNRRGFEQHAEFAAQSGMEAVVKAVKAADPPATAGANLGPWASVIARDEAVAKKVAAMDAQRYAGLVRASSRALFDPDTAVGAAPEELLALRCQTLIVPGADDAHATSAARHLQELIPNNQYKDYVPKDQVPLLGGWILDFLDTNAKK